MSGEPDLRLAELLAAHLCHELIGPVTAIGNGVELLAEEDGGAAARDALTLVGDAASRAAGRLQFYRFVYGSDPIGSAGSVAPAELASRYFDGTRTSCHYHPRIAQLPAVLQQLGCALLLIGAGALPRGGVLVLDAAAPGLQLKAAGDVAMLAPEQVAALTLATPLDALTPRSVHAYFTGALARKQGLRLAAEETAPGRLRLTAAAAYAAAVP